MAKVLTEARTMCPELIEAIKLFDRLSHARNYYQVFSDFIDWLIWQLLFPPTEVDPLENYSEEEKVHFKSIFKIIQEECKQRTSLWTRHPGDVNHLPCWYDPLGRVYQCITSKNKSSRMGQFFTPEPVVDMMVRMNIGQEQQPFVRVLDPACGSGRMGLAASNHLMSRGIACWVTMNDLDQICTKMTAINMCLNGVVGEALCMNGLDLAGNSYRFGYQVQPLLAQFPQEKWPFLEMMGLAKTGQNVRKQYVLLPLSYHATYLKHVNDQLMIEMEKRKEISDQREKDRQLQELKDHIKDRLSGTLFAGDDSLPLPKEKPTIKSSKKPHSQKQPGKQKTLF